MSTRYDYWKTFVGNPEERPPEQAGCRYCAAIHYREDHDELCHKCVRAGVFQCAECGEWLPARMEGWPRRVGKPAELCAECAQGYNGPDVS